MGFGASLAGGMHHAMRGRPSGFCVYNDPAIAISWLLAAGARRVASVDIDVHHADGVQAAFYDNPRVLTNLIRPGGPPVGCWVTGRRAGRSSGADSARPASLADPAHPVGGPRAVNTARRIACWSSTVICKRRPSAQVSRWRSGDV